MHVISVYLHFLDQVSICDDTEFVENQVDATLDEKCFVDFQCFVQQHQVARTEHNRQPVNHQYNPTGLQLYIQ